MAYNLTNLIRVYRDPEQSDFELNAHPEMILEAWAEVVRMSTKERSVADQIYHGADFAVTIRWPEVPVMSSDWIEVVETGERMDIVGLTDPQKDQAYALLSCQSRVSSIGGPQNR